MVLYTMFGILSTAIYRFLYAIFLTNKKRGRLLPPSYVSISNVDHDITAIAALVDAVAFNSAGDGLTADIEFHGSAVLQAYTLRTGAQAERHDQRKN